MTTLRRSTLAGRATKRWVQNNSDPLSMTRLVSSEIESGDFKGAFHVASFEDILASFDDENLQYEALCSKRPPSYPYSSNLSSHTPYWAAADFPQLTAGHVLSPV